MGLKIHEGIILNSGFTYMKLQHYQRKILHINYNLFVFIYRRHHQTLKPMAHL